MAMVICYATDELTSDSEFRMTIFDIVDDTNVDYFFNYFIQRWFKDVNSIPNELIIRKFAERIDIARHFYCSISAQLSEISIQICAVSAFSAKWMAINWPKETTLIFELRKRNYLIDPIYIQNMMEFLAFHTFFHFKIVLNFCCCCGCVFKTMCTMSRVTGDVCCTHTLFRATNGPVHKQRIKGYWVSAWMN